MKGHEGSLNKHSTQFGGSQTAGGQVKVHHMVEGDRRQGDANARQHVSPLGGTDGHAKGGDASPQQEARNRAQSPRPGGPLGRFHGNPDKPI